MQLLQTGKWCSGLSVVHISALEQSKWCSRLSVVHISTCEGALGLRPGSPPRGPWLPAGFPQGFPGHPPVDVWFQVVSVSMFAEKSLMQFE